MKPETSQETGPEVTETRCKLEELPRMLAEKKKEHVTARKEWLTAKLNFEKKYAMVYMTSKANNPEKTQGDLEAMATNSSFDEQLKIIETEATMKLLEIEVGHLSDQWTAALEDSRNLRAELKAGFQG